MATINIACTVLPRSPHYIAGKSQGRTLPSVQQLRYYRNSKHQTACSDPILVFKPRIRRETAGLWNEIFQCSVQVEATGPLKRWYLAPVLHDVTSLKTTLVAITFRAEREDRLAFNGELDS